MSCTLHLHPPSNASQQTLFLILSDILSMYKGAQLLTYSKSISWYQGRRDNDLGFHLYNAIDWKKCLWYLLQTRGYYSDIRSQRRYWMWIHWRYLVSLWTQGNVILDVGTRCVESKGIIYYILCLYWDGITLKPMISKFSSCQLNTNVHQNNLHKSRRLWSHATITHYHLNTVQLFKLHRKYLAYHIL